MRTISAILNISMDERRATLVGNRRFRAVCTGSKLCRPSAADVNLGFVIRCRNWNAGPRKRPRW